MKEILSYTQDELKQEFKSRNIPAFRANQLYTALLQGKTTDKITTLPKQLIEELEKEFSGNGRVLIRPSGTEPKIKFYMGIKGTSHEDADKMLDDLKCAMKKVVE